MELSSSIRKLIIVSSLTIALALTIGLIIKSDDNDTPSEDLDIAQISNHPPKCDGFSCEWPIK